jgi:acyl carrier protein
MEHEGPREPHSPTTSGRSISEIQEWLIRRLAEELQIGPEKITTDQPIVSFGIDSVQVVSIVAQLEDWGGFRFSENPLDDYPTIEALSRFVAGLKGK